MPKKALQHFYIAQEQSIYLLSHKDATKLKKWVELCQQQLTLLGYQHITLIGKGAYGFVFAGQNKQGQQQVFKFSRTNLPQHVQDRLADEADIQRQLQHSRIPKIFEYYKIKHQSILHMERAPGIDLEQLSHQQGPLESELVMKIAIQLVDILIYLRDASQHSSGKPYVHGDIKPSNVVFDKATEKVYLIDWGSAVTAQLDNEGHSTSNNVMDLMSTDLHTSNARLGDVYFIGEEQLNGALSSPRFDEQGLAATLYALASGQSCRYGSDVITPSSLGLPKILANILTGMLSKNRDVRNKAGDYLFNNIHLLKNIVLADPPIPISIKALVPIWYKRSSKSIDTVVYGSRKSFLREASSHEHLYGVDDAQLEKYYKNYLMGMGDIEKAFIAAVNRLGNFPVVGGLAIRWENKGVYFDSNLLLFDSLLKKSFESAVNNVIYLAQGIDRIGVFKSCLFDAHNTLHVERDNEYQPFKALPEQCFRYDISDVADIDDVTRLHSYFEDGKDPDEYLHLPDEIMSVLTELNSIHHTGCIIFEVLPTHLKIHSYLKLLNHDKEPDFKYYLAKLLELLPTIKGVGISGFMKLPYKNTRFFQRISSLPEHFYPRNPKSKVTETG